MATNLTAPLKHALRPELEPLPKRMLDLAVDKRGYPVPFFVAYVNGEPEFRIMDRKKWDRCVNEWLCWVCGERLGVHMTFVVGPMCGINRTTSEPPSHRECASWSARNCPFLARPNMVRRDYEGETHSMGGIGIQRNPGVTLLWTTRDYKLFGDGKGGTLIQIGEPEATEWYACGKPATRAQVMDSVESGIPLLAAVAQEQEGAMEDLLKRKKWLMQRYPVA